MLKAAALGVVLQPHIVLYCLHLYLCLFVCVTLNRVSCAHLCTKITFRNSSDVTRDFSRDFVISVDFRFFVFSAPKFLNILFLSIIKSPTIVMDFSLATHNREYNGFITFCTTVVAYRRTAMYHEDI
ncbi:hypothetical protein T4B_2489 [Trichinella pseudospiralis]|uniref:Uncharacterized protein n=1 Tax=Trichinella pseudospiralis TaxID=6337 RepID=A0A0V1ICW5_TRIPS|nr:hypothetical protein T4B_2489 [Trichinella pseudospiralis]KRZ41464.1 hypothetical protein T4C_10466 [Trichinella pseudospiralis]